MQVVSRRVVFPTPGTGVGAYAVSHYTRAAGGQKVMYRKTMTRSDTIDSCDRCWSEDHGETWSDPTPMPTHEQTPQGMLRRHPRAGWVDVRTDRLVSLMVEGILPSDKPIEGMKHWYLVYTVSHDGGRTDAVRQRIVQQGSEYSAEHPMAGVWLGRNAAQIGDYGSRPLCTSGGRMLFPIQISPVGPDGEYYNPGGGYTWHECAVLIGTWSSDGTILWNLSENVKQDPARSTRGCIEPTIAQLRDGRILMVMRGSNDAKPHLPGHKWFSISRDEGSTWSALEPWTYDDGDAFFSPSSMSQLLPHSSGRLFWLGNITPENPRGNLPRYPLVMGEVDLDSGRLKRSSVTVIDKKKGSDSARMMLSNFMAHEDRRNGNVLLNMSRAFHRSEKEWTTDAYEYRIEL